MKNLCKKVSIMALLLVIVLIFGGITANSDSFMPPEPFEIWSEDETMVFRWNPGYENNWFVVAQAGVYRNNELVYSVDNLPIMGSHAGEFLFSTDFRHFVFIPQVGQSAALGFFEDGVLLRAYRIDELVRDMNVIIYSVTMAGWESWQGRSFDAANNTMTIVTRDDITYVFDITTGKIIYDTVGDAPFIPHPEDSWGYFANDVRMPLWAQVAREDMPSSWAQEYTERAGELGLLPDSFRLGFGRNTTRAEFAAIAIALYEFFREPITGRVTFTDTTDTNVEKAAYLGIVSGVGNNHFDPNSPITREQAAVMLNRLVELFGFHSHNVFPQFDDHQEISAWAMLAVGHIQAREIMSGVGGNRFAPQDLYTREQSIVTILRLFDMVNTGLPNTLETADTLNYAEFLGLLEASGFVFESIIGVPTRGRMTVYIGDENLVVQCITIPFEDSITPEVEITWAPEFYWHTGGLMSVIYSGDDSRIIEFLNITFGYNFAR